MRSHYSCMGLSNGFHMMKIALEVLLINNKTFWFLKLSPDKILHLYYSVVSNYTRKTREIKLTPEKTYRGIFSGATETLICLVSVPFFWSGPRPDEVEECTTLPDLVEWPQTRVELVGYEITPERFRMVLVGCGRFWKKSSKTGFFLVYFCF